MKYIVYLTTNLINNKIYIGVHQTENPDIFDGYLGCGSWISKPYSYNKCKYPIHAAINKYGPKNFKRITLKVFDKLEDALDLERWLVTEEFIKRSDTYNAVLGGGLQPKTNKKVYQFDIYGKLIKEWESGISINKYYRCSVSIIEIINQKRSFAGSYWSYNNTIDVNNYKSELNHGFINQYNLNGDFLSMFKNATEASQKLDIDLKKIISAVFRKKPCEGYYFLKSDVDIAQVISPVFNHKYGKSHIYEYDKNGNYLKYYNSLLEVKKINNYSAYRLKKSILNKTILNDKYYSYYKSNNIKNIIKTSKPIIKILQYDLKGNFIKEWESIKSCKKQFKNCTRVCQGYLKSTDGYVFKYKIKDIV